MRPSNDLLPAVIDFVSDRIGIARESLAPNTMLRLHLDIDGTLAVAFLEAFAQCFSVNMTDFPFHKYFHDDEQIRLLSPALEFARRFCRRLCCRFGLYDPGPQITLRDLAQAATAGRWQEPEGC